MRKIFSHSGSLFLMLVVLVACGLYFACLRESPQESKMVFEESDVPGADRLFVPIKLDVAEKLLCRPVIRDGWRLSADEEDGCLVLEGECLRDVLDFVDLRADAVWKELGKYDSKLSLSPDLSRLNLGIHEDELTGEDYVNVPAGLLRAYIK